MKNGKKILVTGGAGFIGSHLVRYLTLQYPDYQIFNLDALTYAGNLENLHDIAGRENYRFLKADIRDEKEIFSLFDRFGFDTVIHLAAESHVDRSIDSPNLFLETNLTGTANLMNAFLHTHGKDLQGKLFYHISTDEVFGSLGDTGYFTENSPYRPRSPYAASKAAADLLVKAYGNTYGLPFLISNCSNNFGPNQFPEKLIPLVINNIKNNREIPVYGDGSNIRDWIYVSDHISAIDTILHRGTPGETYLVGGGNEMTNIDLVLLLCDITDRALGRKPGTSKELVTFVADRKGHDKRYAIDDTKIKTGLGWKPRREFKEALSETVDWYLSHTDWLDKVTSGEYLKYYEKHYKNRKLF